MTNELKPCPFCGGEPEIAKYEHNGKELDNVWWCGCHDCHIGRIESSEFEAVEAWNTRYKRTCKWYHDGYHDEANNIWTTECGERYYWEECGHPPCCPGCGAEVVDGD